MIARRRSAPLARERRGAAAPQTQACRDRRPGAAAGCRGFAGLAARRRAGRPVLAPGELRAMRSSSSARTSPCRGSVPRRTEAARRMLAEAPARTSGPPRLPLRTRSARPRGARRRRSPRALKDALTASGSGDPVAGDLLGHHLEEDAVLGGRQRRPGRPVDARDRLLDRGRAFVGARAPARRRRLRTSARRLGAAERAVEPGPRSATLRVAARRPRSAPGLRGWPLGDGPCGGAGAAVAACA